MWRLWIVLLLACWPGLPVVTPAESPPQVHAVIFYSSSCVHCRHVIEDVLPPLRERVGSGLAILYVDVSGPTGAALFAETCAALAVPSDRRGLVPTVLVGGRVLVGSGAIEDELPELIAHGLEAGGVGLPQTPGMAEYAARVEQLREEQRAAEVPPTTDPEISGEQTWSERLRRDLPVGVVAVVVLGLLALGGGLTIRAARAAR